MIFKLRLLLVSPLLVVLAGGCGSSSSAPASVHGTVKYNGKLVTAGTVTFIGNGTYPLPINKDGTYAGRDLPIGELVVTVETESAKPAPPPKVQGTEYGPMQKGQMQMAKMLKKGDPSGTEASAQAKGEYVKIPARYSDPKQTPLKVNVTKGDQKIDLELTD